MDSLMNAQINLSTVYKPDIQSVLAFMNTKDTFGEDVIAAIAIRTHIGSDQVIQ